MPPTAQRPESHDNAGGPGVLPAETSDRPDEAQPTARLDPNPFRAAFAALAAEADRVRAEAKRRYNRTIARVADTQLRTTNTGRKATPMPTHTTPAMAGEPTCGQPTPEGPCWRVAGHQGACKG